MKNQCRKSEGFLLTPLCCFGNKFVKRGIGDRLVSFTAARAGVTQGPCSRLRDSGPSEAKETCEIYNKLVSSYCSRFSTFLSLPRSSAMVLLVFLSFFACLLNRQIEEGVTTESPERLTTAFSKPNYEDLYGNLWYKIDTERL